jgi:hypothetical protein
LKETAHQKSQLANFDYSAPADVYIAHAWGSKAPVTFRRFASSAEAIRFAVEELPRSAQRGIAMEVGDDRFQFINILDLYVSERLLSRRDARLVAPTPQA